MNEGLHDDQFSGIRQLQCEQCPQQVEVLQPIKPMAAVTKLPTHDHDSFLYSFLARTTPHDHASLDISFERNFLDQHINTLEAILQNSEESIATTQLLQPSGLPTPHTSPTQPPSSTTTLLAFLQANQLAGQMTEAHQLIKDLQKQPDLSSFITHFINKYSKQLAIGLTLITADLWSSVHHQSLRHLEMRELQKITHQWARINSPKYLERTDLQPLVLLFTSPHNLQSQNSGYESFVNKLIIFSTTLVLIAGGYFQNPYVGGQLPPQLLSEIDYPKRQSPCLESEFQSCSQFFLECEGESKLEKRPKLQ